VAGANDIHIQTLVTAINYELGNYGSTLDLNAPIMLHQGNDAEVEALIKEMEAGKVDALIIAGANPVYTLPKSSKFAAALKKVALSVSFSGYADETASLCTYVCPDHNYLEKWNDFSPMHGTYCLAQPLIRPLHNTRDWQESLFVWAGLAPRGDKDSTVYYTFLRSTWKKYGYEMGGGNSMYSTFDDYWNWNVHNSYAVAEMPEATAMVTTETSNIVKAVPFGGDVSAAGAGVSSVKGGKWEVSFYVKSSMGAGDQANNPWLQELPYPITRVNLDN
jgi:molybdopterin-containing oxidoreductase family iron-sulfur binding subunit